MHIFNFRDELRQMLKVIHRFRKHCIWHVQGESNMFAETLNNFPHSTRLVPKCQAVFWIPDEKT
jgi:hypothetical protein